MYFGVLIEYFDGTSNRMTCIGNFIKILKSGIYKYMTKILRQKLYCLTR